MRWCSVRFRRCVRSVTTSCVCWAGSSHTVRSFSRTTSRISGLSARYRPLLHVTRRQPSKSARAPCRYPILGSTGLGAREVRGTHSPVGVQAVISLQQAENRAMVLARHAQKLTLVPLYGVTYDLRGDVFVVIIKIAGRAYHCGQFHDAKLAGYRADEVWRILDAPEKCNFDAEGNPTGSHESAASVKCANLTIRGADRRLSEFSGVVTDKSRLKSGGKAYRAQVSVPDCRENQYACPFDAAGAKCNCKPLHTKRSTTFYTQEEAAGAWNGLVVKWKLHEMKVEPLVLNRLR
jgi:hypothetical protein